MKEQEINWEKWASWKVSEVRFRERREPLLRHPTYSKRFDDKLGGIASVTIDLPKHVTKAKPSGLMTSTRRRLWNALDWTSLQYSAGGQIDEISQIWPHSMNWAEQYASFHEAYHASPEAEDQITPHATLRDEEYWIVALRMVCFGILSGFGRDMPRVMAFLDYGNEDMGVRDGLIERLVAPFVADRGAPPSEATRHLPYRKLFKVFDATPGERPALMATYLNEWYHASRREPYVDQHGEADVSFYGYWSWEAAATTVVLDIDDSGYRDMSFYPRDWVDYARSKNAGPPSDIARESFAAGDTVPRTGWWFTPALSRSRRHFQQGDTFPNIEGSQYGTTFWQWDIDQSDPKL
ncbi:PoNe immunity protein domain-containing protein [Cupriavidus sp. HPC(L)]|uniref:PoNe immunity protein domain-containing protein n=1 Tax=Cupriavidus sp. HPC(L) TaxID=1217418 RepID=UPI0009FA68D3|nr:PoNe immunity protein domain-containing protein [Cupriavidus sp. HPC(L)]